MVELVLKMVHDDLRLSCPALIPHVQSYRAGYTAHHRRSVEQAFFAGQVRCTSHHITSHRISPHPSMMFSPEPENPYLAVPTDEDGALALDDITTARCARACCAMHDIIPAAPRACTAPRPASRPGT